MTYTQIIGAVILASPFVLLFGWVVREEGWRVAAGIFLFVFFLTALITFGSALLAGPS